jgi:hypothetical protein
VTSERATEASRHCSNNCNTHCGLLERSCVEGNCGILGAKLGDHVTIVYIGLITTVTTLQRGMYTAQYSSQFQNVCAARSQQDTGQCPMGSAGAEKTLADSKSIFKIDLYQPSLK